MNFNKIKQIMLKYRTLDLIFYVYDLTLMGAFRRYSTSIFYLKSWLRGVEVKSGYKIWGKVFIKKFPGSNIKIGENLFIVSSPLRYSLNIFPQTKLLTLSPEARIRIGDNVGFNSLTIMCRSTSVSIGDRTLIGGNCQILDNDGHQLWPAVSRFSSPGIKFDEPVIIGKNVFIGLNVIILKGVEIGDNSIIAAGSVVTSAIPADCVAAGAPARVIKYNERK
ncbi:MAG: acetyltransferase-like isoleucine patch superfamily enzyme [Enterobacterales bacterium]|jgi:acetyltransferase-like isoleucine patch superfamily enzyme